jgi:hypothetical protein
MTDSSRPHRIPGGRNMANSQFNSPATLLADGSVAVEGSLEVDHAAVLSEVEFRFLIVQGEVVVQGTGRGSAGVWSGTAPGGQGDLEEGDALAIGLAFVGRRSPAGYETFSWADRIRLAP